VVALAVLPVRAVLAAQVPLLVQQPRLLVRLAKDVVVRAQLLLLPVGPALRVQAPREAAVRVDVAVRLLTRSFSAATAGVLPLPGPPM